MQITKDLEATLKKLDRQEKMLCRDIKCMERCLAEWTSKVEGIKKQRGLIMTENPLTEADVTVE